MTMFSSYVNVYQAGKLGPGYSRKSCCFHTISRLIVPWCPTSFSKKYWNKAGAKVDPICCFEFYWDILCLPSNNVENLRNVAIYHLVTSLVDPENHQFLVETNLPTPICQGLCLFTGGYMEICSGWLVLFHDFQEYGELVKQDGEMMMATVSFVKSSYLYIWIVSQRMWYIAINLQIADDLKSFKSHKHGKIKDLTSFFYGVYIIFTMFIDDKLMVSGINIPFSTISCIMPAALSPTQQDDSPAQCRTAPRMPPVRRGNVKNWTVGVSTLRHSYEPIYIYIQCGAPQWC